MFTRYRDFMANSLHKKAIVIYLILEVYQNGFK